MDRLLILASSFICTKQTMVTLIDSNDDCTSTTYIIESERLVEGEIIDKLPTSGFQDCLIQCSKQQNCTAVNFLMDVNDDPICLLMNRVKKASDSEMPIPESIMYSATSICLSQNSRCANGAIWSFEKFPKKDLINEKFAGIVDQISSLEQCLATCLEREQCKAILYNKKSGQCRHSKISLHSVHSVRKFFRRNEDVDLYENNCNQISPLNVSQCQFIRTHSSGFTNFFDERVSEVSDEMRCEQICLTWNRGNCHFFTYHRGLRLCYLSHRSPQTLNRNSLENYDTNLSSGDLEDCMKFKVKCKPDRMHIHGTSMKIFSGILKTKNDKKIPCERRFLNVYEFDAEILYDECGMRKTFSPYLTFSNLLMLKDGSTELITIRDKLLQVNCRLHNEMDIVPNQHLSFQFQLEDENVTKQILAENMRMTKQLRGYVTQPKYTLEVMDANKNPVEEVQIGNEGYLIITSQEKSIEFLAIDVIAREINSDKTITIIDSDGCATPNGILKDMQQIDENHLQLTIIFDGFPNEANVIYQAYVKQCDDLCDFSHCNSINFTHIHQFNMNTRRKRQSLVKLSDSRLYELSEDIYAVKSSTKLKMRNKSRKGEKEINDFNKSPVMMPYEENKSVGSIDKHEEQITAIRMDELECIIEDVNRLLVFLSLCLQAIVLISIICFIYAIIQYCTRTQRNREDLILIQNADNAESITSKVTKS